MPRVWAGLGLVVAALLVGRSGAQDCSGHGQLGDDGSTCVCENSQPGKGQWGWAGSSCDMRVYGVAADGSDVTEGCRSEGCDTLAPDEWICFAAPLTWTSESDQWNYLTVQLARTSEDDKGDPDIYGLFYGGQSGQAKQLEKRTYGYDFRETSSSSRAQVTKRMPRSDFGVDSDYTGVYLCVKAYGEVNTSFALRATTTQCPADFADDGSVRVCSSAVDASPKDRRSEGCSPEGECMCKPPWNKPVSAVYPGLGFEDCTARTTNVTDFELLLGKAYQAQHQEVAPSAWNFYAFNVTDEDYQIVVNLAGEKDSPCAGTGYMELYLKFGQPPDYHYGHYDLRPASSWYYDDSDIELALDPTNAAFQRGLWYAGVQGDDRDSCLYSLSIVKYQCPLNCNGRGSCQHNEDGTRTCICNQGFFGEDCSGETKPLAYDQQVSTEESLFEYDHYQLPAVTPSMLSHNVEVKLVASFSSSQYSEWSAAIPEMLLLNAQEDDAVPTAANHTFKVAMEAQNTDYEINLCPSMLSQGNWKVAIYSPLRLYPLAYKLAARKLAHCLNDCNGNGDCDNEGMCHCHDNWTGGDCSVNQHAACAPKSRQGTHMPEAHGTCWSECKCDSDYTNCKYETSSCVDFSCDHGWRRKGSANECVQDGCTKDKWAEADSHSCLQECVCPADGSACQLADACLKDSFACKDGYKRFSNGDTKCYKTGCQATSLQAAMTKSVNNGKAYGVCTCGTEESEDHDLCSYHTDDLSSMAISCNDGYALVGAQKLEGSDVYVGGRCVHATRGTPGWGVFLWVFFSLMSGAVGGIGALWFYEHRYKRSSLNDSLYHELSMDTGF